MTENDKKNKKEKPDITKELEAYKKQKANLLMPSTKVEVLSEFHQPVIEKVHLNPDPDQGDVYPEGGGDDDKPKKFRITAQGLRKLSACVGILWHPTECKRLDDRHDRDYVAYQAVGGVRKTDGTPVFYKAEYDLDFEVIEEELRELYNNKCKNWNKPQAQKDGYIEHNVKRDLIQKRKHKIKLAETGAMMRVVRSMLGLKSSYTAEELKHPFVMIRIGLAPDYNDPEVRKQMLGAMIKQATGIYGTPIDFPQIDTIDMDSSQFQSVTLDEDSEPESGDNDRPFGSSSDDKNDHTEPDPEELAEQEFIAADSKSQVQILEKLIKQKNYNKENLKKPLSDFSDKYRLDFYHTLIALPDTIPDNDIPF